MDRLIPDFELHAPESEITEIELNNMRIDTQDEIIEQLRKNTSLSFEDLKRRTGRKGQDLRAALRELIHEESGVYVQGVEEKTKFYAYKDD